MNQFAFGLRPCCQCVAECENETNAHLNVEIHTNTSTAMRFLAVPRLFFRQLIGAEYSPHFHNNEAEIQIFSLET